MRRERLREPSTHLFFGQSVSVRLDRALSHFFRKLDDMVAREGFTKKVVDGYVGWRYIEEGAYGWTVRDCVS